LGHTQRVAVLAVIVAAGLSLSLITPSPWVFALAAATIVVACLGSDQIIHGYWRQHLRRQRRRYDITLWIFPALIVAGSFLVLRLPFFNSTVAIGLGVAAATLLFGAVVVCQLHSLSTEDQHYPLARFVLTLLVYLSAFGIYSAIYAPRIRSAYSATAVFLVTMLLCLELFRGQSVDGRRAATYSVVLGLAVGEVTWALNYWLVSPLAGGLLMLVVLYAGAGIAQTHMSGELSGRTLLEFSGVAAAAILLVLGVGILPR
jgi:hypothetical protein